MNLKLIKWLGVGLCLLTVISVVVISIISYTNTITPSGIVIHHSATMPNRILRPSDIQAISDNHQKKGFSMFYWGKIYHVGYHYVILPGGAIVQTRPENSIGAHASGYNSYIGICLIGNFTDKNDQSLSTVLDRPSLEQMTALIALTKQLRRKYHISTESIVTHHGVNVKTECPGENFSMNDFMREIESYQY